ncbi:MAG: hypothetical protein EBU88_13590 [Acidobacteria bacterium]|nr:hypothetical protein [Acidobacteriota bacterium]
MFGLIENKFQPFGQREQKRIVRTVNRGEGERLWTYCVSLACGTPGESQVVPLIFLPGEGGAEERVA